MKNSILNVVGVQNLTKQEQMIINGGGIVRNGIVEITDIGGILAKITGSGNK